MDCKQFEGPKEKISGDVMRYNSADEDNFTQVGIFYRNVSTELLFLYSYINLDR